MYQQNNNQVSSKVNLPKLIIEFSDKYKIKVNMDFLNKNIIRLEEYKIKNGNSYYELLKNAENAKITALTIIDLSNKGLVFNEDFNIIPFKNKLTTVINSHIYKKAIERAGYSGVSHNIIFAGEHFEWNPITNAPSMHTIDLSVNTSNFDNIIGAYATAFKNGAWESILIRKSDILRWRDSAPSGNNQYSPWIKWPKEMVEAKLFRALAKKLGVKIGDIDLDEKAISLDENGNVDYEYITFKELEESQIDKKDKIVSRETSNEIKSAKLESARLEEAYYSEENNIVIEDDISDIQPQERDEYSGW